MGKNIQQRQKIEELGLTIKIEVDGCLGPAVYRKTIYTFYTEHDENYLYIQDTVLSVFN